MTIIKTVTIMTITIITITIITIMIRTIITIITITIITIIIRSIVTITMTEGTGNKKGTVRRVIVMKVRTWCKTGWCEHFKFCTMPVK